ncbi:T9SS type A sorting domain-containing protein [Sediminicola luteus]|uniref:Secretion protein n=1 Tax=Sediminicola luteus TaxID=319238 RepID=A0A2A4G834_9FLAO|nr:T9SS type A sorting domain-containing protein [Sediminicola luteus]PCE64130.1 hypothetical protein B7P33_12935 [Sediminicola luteus]
MFLKLVYIGLFFSMVSLSAQIQVKRLGILPEALKETSGLAIYNDSLISHNDSGGAPSLYVMDSLGMQIGRSIVIENAENVDWEDLAQDQDFLYIGDIGNNTGSRKQLTIYRVPLVALESNKVTAESIRFTYPDQPENETGQSDWDAEALVVKGDSLVVFTKRWKSMDTRAYTIPKIPGEFTARQVATFPVNGLVTSADYSTENGLVLLGYSDTLAPFLLWQKSNTESLFGTESVKSTLSVSYGQMEALVGGIAAHYYLSSEYFERQTPSVLLWNDLFRATIPFEKTPEESTGAAVADEIILFGAENGLLGYRFTGKSKMLTASIFDGTGKLVVPFTRLDTKEGAWDLSVLPSGIYYMVVQTPDGYSVKAFPWAG